MKIIMCVKEGMLANIMSILISFFPCGLALWWGIYRNKFLLTFVALAFPAWLIWCFAVIRDMRNPKSATLAIDGDHLTWIVRKVESGEEEKGAIPLKSIRSLEFVLPVMKYEVNAKNYSLAELFLVD